MLQYNIAVDTLGGTYTEVYHYSAVSGSHSANFHSWLLCWLGWTLSWPPSWLGWPLAWLHWLLCQLSWPPLSLAATQADHSTDHSVDSAGHSTEHLPHYGLVVLMTW